MTDKPTPTTDLLKRCTEIHEWRSTGVLSGEALRDYAKRKWPDRHDTLQMAEHETVTEALALLAKWGQPAQETNGRKVFVCTHCDGVYADQPVTQCDCLPDENTFTEGWICFGAPAQAAEPVAWLSPWRKDQVTTDYDAYGKQGIPLVVAQQAGAVPLDEARRLFDAGWKAAALFCEREDVVADGIIGFGACPQFEAAFSAANGIKGGQHGTE